MGPGQGNVGGHHIRQIKPVDFTQRLTQIPDGVVPVALGPDVPIIAIFSLYDPMTAIQLVISKPPPNDVVTIKCDQCVIAAHPIKVVPIVGTVQRFIASGAIG